MNELNPVKTEVTVAGSPCYFKELTLHQSFNNHHRFEIKVDYEEFEDVWLENPTKIIQLIGKEVGITMEHQLTHEVNLFKGIITNVSMNGQHGEKNYITIFGCSPTIKLDGTPSMDSFMDLTLDTITTEAVTRSGNGAEVTIAPVYKSKIDYICQYDETVFAFINRLSWLYGEWFFYDGTTTFFGKPDLGDPEIITYDEEMTHFDLTANLIPPKVNRIEYLNHDNYETSSKTPDTVDGVRGYIKAALNQANEVYTSEAVRRLEASILTKKQLDDLVKVDKYRMVSQMLIMKGNTHTCKIKIGKLISVNLPMSMRTTLKHIETFLVTEITHSIGQDGKYNNSFTAIPSEMENIPMTPIKAPIALPQVAWVKSNADDKGKGRIKVQLQWQKGLNKTTNWIRVQTPDAGSSTKVASNRGFVFIPEVDDLVMINFENGDPNRPYVTGSIFRENISKGGGQDSEDKPPRDNPNEKFNKSKSLTTRSGSTVTLDDNEGKGCITISDPSGNKAYFDGAENITIDAPTSLTINVGENKLTMNKDGKMYIKTDTEFKIEVGGNVFTMTTDSTTLNTPSTIEIESSSNKVTGQNHITGGDTKIDGGNVFIN